MSRKDIIKTFILAPLRTQKQFEEEEEEFVLGAVVSV